jgi:hypothetical protein
MAEAYRVGSCFAGGEEALKAVIQRYLDGKSGHSESGGEDGKWAAAAGERQHRENPNGQQFMQLRKLYSARALWCKPDRLCSQRFVGSKFRNVMTLRSFSRDGLSLKTPVFSLH